MLISDATNLAMLNAAGAEDITAPGSVTFRAIFDNEFIETGNSPGVETRQPVLTCRTSDVAALGLEMNNVLVVRGENYRFKRHEPDGTGISRVVLKR